MPSYFGSSASETLNSSNWNYSWTGFYMGAGNDSVVTPSTGVAYFFSGEGGNDYFLGDRGADEAWGGDGNDTLSGYSGNDYLNGQSNNDYLNGGSGVDHLWGGLGADQLVGGYDTSADYFHVAPGDSASTRAGADTILDWDVRYDYIDSEFRGTASNYGEMSTTANNIETARSIVEGSGLRTGDYAFLYNGANDTGYLLADLDRNYSFETGVVIKGAGSASDMNWSDII